MTMNKILSKTIIFFAFIGISCAPPSLLLHNTGSPSLKKQINTLIVESHLDVNMSLKVTALKSGKILYALNSQKKLMPASNNKLYTSATALANLGSGYVFETAIYQDGKNLILKGGGDPDFSLSTLDSLAKIVSSYIKNIDTLYIDESLMDTLHYGNGWMWDEGEWWYAAPISALSLNDNCIDFYVQPAGIGEPPLIKTNPETHYIQIENNAITVNDTLDFNKLKIERDWIGQNNHFTVSGELMDTSALDTIFRNINHPPLFAGTVFKEFLEKYDVTIKYMTLGSKSKNARLLANHQSDSLFYSAKSLLAASDNLTAELFIKTMGISKDKAGNWADGIRIVKTFLADSAHIDTAEIRMADGSGVSRYNLTSADQFIQLLTYMYESPFKDDFLSILPTGGNEGTLRDRLLTNGGRIKAKTGHLSGVSCISGYAFSPKYGPLAFSFMMNGYIGSSKNYRKLQDAILGVLIHD